MLKWQVWITDDDEFAYIIKNSQIVFGLNAQYEHQPYIQEFRKECNVIFVYGTYALEGEADARSFTKQLKQLLQANDKRFESIELITSDLLLNTKIIKQTHNIMIDGKDVLVGEYRRSPVFTVYHIFVPVGYIERYMEDAIFRFHKIKKGNPIMAATSIWKHY